MDDNIRAKLAEISAQWRSAGKIGPAVSKSVSQAYELGKAEGIKEGMRRAAAMAGTMAERPFDSEPEFSAVLAVEAAILKEAGE